MEYLVIALGLVGLVNLVHFRLEMRQDSRDRITARLREIGR